MEALYALPPARGSRTRGRSVDEIAHEVGVDVGPPVRVTGWQTEPGSALEGQYVWRSLPAAARSVASLAARLIPGFEALAQQVRYWEVRAQEIEREHAGRLAEARSGLDQLRAAAVDDPSKVVELSAAARVVADLSAGHAEVRKAAHIARMRGYNEYNQVKDGLFDAAAAQCATVVEKVAGLVEAIPEKVWGAADPERALVEAGVSGVWGALSECRIRWAALHELADLLREEVGAEHDRIRSGAPRWAVHYRNWEAAFAEMPWRLKQLPEPLQLAYAVKHGWQPGIWRPAQVDAGPAGPPRSLAQRFADVFTAAPAPPREQTAAELGVG